jgi:hypothetical protein
MKWSLIIVILLLAGIVIAAKTNSGGWFIITSTSENFTTNDPVNQYCNLAVNESCIMSWTINSTGPGGLYELKSIFNWSEPNVTFENTELYFNVSIFDKGENGVIPNYSCAYCSFQVTNGTNTTTENPTVLGNMNRSSIIAAWNITATGHVNTTWEVFGIINYNSSNGNQTVTEAKKVRIVDYPWWNTSWNCRRMINVTQNTGTIGDGIIEIDDFQPVYDNVTDDFCRVINCTKDLKITEIDENGFQHNLVLSVLDEEYSNALQAEYCNKTTLKFMSTMNAGEEKQYFVYFGNPVAEGSSYYFDPDIRSISNNTFSSLIKYDTERVWNLYFDSHIDFSWNYSTDGVSYNSRNSSNITKKYLQQLGYNTQVQVNRIGTDFLERIDNDEIYWIFVHGGVHNMFGGYNQTQLSIKKSTPYDFLLSDDINATHSDKLKFVMALSCFGGDNSTTLINCTLNNWPSKAFIEKGADCYLSFLGVNITTVCPTDCNSCEGDTYTPDIDHFNECFWGNISTGRTIKQSAQNATVCQSEDMHYILVNSTIDGCDKVLIK